jgi:sugar-phosphatase
MPVAPLPPRPPVRAAIFDMDGLLVDSEPVWRIVTLEVLDELGSDVRPIIDRGLTKGMRVDESLALFRALAPWPGAGDAATEHAARERIVAGVVAAIETAVELLPGALEALDFFADAGAVLALASGSVPAVVNAVVDRFALRPRFAAIVSAVDVPLGKPHPQVFLDTASLIGMAPVECVVLEDSVNGCIAAKAAQMRAIAVPAVEDREDARFAIADIVLDSLKAISTPEVATVLGLPVDPNR